ncbi:hypothetical protein AOLI_G00325700 [Acnodon oligacanthus]
MLVIRERQFSLTVRLGGPSKGGKRNSDPSVELAFSENKQQNNAGMKKTPRGIIVSLLDLDLPHLVHSRSNSSQTLQQLVHGLIIPLLDWKVLSSEKFPLLTLALYLVVDHGFASFILARLCIDP